MIGVRYYVLTSFVVLLGAIYGNQFVKFCDEHPSARRGDLARSLAAWDGEWYEKIASKGYSYNPDQQSPVAFYPGYPLLAAAISRFTDTRTALLIVSNSCLVAALVLLDRYLSAAPSELRQSVVLTAAIFPTTFYFRMAYSESLFLLLCTAAMLGMLRKWPALLIAIVIGAACGTRPLGVALLLPFLIHLWPEKRDGAASLRFSLLAAALLPIACWGLFAYGFYQWFKFGDSTAFLKTQQHWGQSEGDPFSHALRLLTLAPLRSVYESRSPGYWALRPPRDAAIFNMMFANPIYFAGSVAAVVLGAWKRWLNAKEVALAAGLLLIPYVTQADRMYMASMARFASVAFPVYITIGQILVRLPGPIVGILASLSATMLAIYTALFLNWYWYY